MKENDADLGNNVSDVCSRGDVWSISSHDRRIGLRSGRGAERGPGTSRVSGLRIPSILLESDFPVAATAGGPGQRYAIAPRPVAELAVAEGELPEAYGTEALLLVARDPRWLYAHWDLTQEQQRRYCARSRDGRLVLRVFRDVLAGRPCVELQLQSMARHTFVHVDWPGAGYVAELGLYHTAGGWESIARSGAVRTPADAVSPDTSVRFATISQKRPATRLAEMIREAVREQRSLQPALEEWRRQGQPELPWWFTPPPPAGETGAELGGVEPGEKQEAVLDLEALLGLKPAAGYSSVVMAQAGSPGWSGEVMGGISSFGEEQPRREFRLEVNVDLVIYGRTEADAAVTLGGRRVKLRPDGTFSCRYALPDGIYELTLVAVAADGAESRAARLSFSRVTERRGAVGVVPLDPALKPPDRGEV